MARSASAADPAPVVTVIDDQGHPDEPARLATGVEGSGMSASEAFDAGDAGEVAQRGGGTTQDLAVTILPGPFTVTPSDATVRLHRVGGHRFKGTVGPVGVTDARASLAGWALKMAVDAEPAFRPMVRPMSVVARTGRSGEAAAGRPARAGATTPVLLMSAPAGGGGGIFEIAASVELDDGPLSGPDVIAVPVHLALT